MAGGHYAEGPSGANDLPPPPKYHDGPQPDIAQPPMPATSNVTYVNAVDTSVRLAFLRKVYTLLTINFLITTGISCAFAFIIPLREWIVEHRWVVWISIGVALAAFIALVCIKIRFPVNLILMYVFVAAFSVMIGSLVASYFDAGYGVIVLQAFCVTAAMFVTITAYCFVTKKDFSFLYSFISVGLIALVVLIVINIVFGLNGSRNRWFSFGISLLGYV